MGVLQLIWLCEIMGSMLLMCQNTTMRVYGARIKIYCVLCSKHIAVRGVFPMVRDKPPGGARICATGLVERYSTASRKYIKATKLSYDSYTKILFMCSKTLWIYNVCFQKCTYSSNVTNSSKSTNSTTAFEKSGKLAASTSSRTASWNKCEILLSKLKLLCTIIASGD